MRRHRLPPVLVAGIMLIPAIGASGGRAVAQVLPLPTTTTSSTTTTTSTTTTSTTTTSTTSASTTTTTAAPGTTTTSTTALAEEEQLTVESLGGSLSISAPTAVQLSAGTPTTAGTLSAVLGTVTVTDERGAEGASWTATVATTHFSTGAATAAETIDRANVSYWSGPATASAGIAVFTPGQLTALLAQVLSVPRTAFTMASGVGDSWVSWAPTVSVTIPPAAVVGLYSGTITHSVA